MRLFEFILSENVSPDASLRNIVDILTVQFPQLFHSLEVMAEKMFDNNGNIKALNFVSGSRKSDWYNNVYFNTMKPALYNYARSLPPAQRSELVKQLGTNDVNFSGVAEIIIPELSNIARATRNTKLSDAVQAAEHAMQRYDKKITQLEIAGQKNNTDDDDEPPQEREQNLIPQQNVAVEALIQDVLSRLPRGQAGDIRNAIARKANKLQALQQELAARGINL